MDVRLYARQLSAGLEMAVEPKLLDSRKVKIGDLTITVEKYAMMAEGEDVGKVYAFRLGPKLLAFYDEYGEVRYVADGIVSDDVASVRVGERRLDIFASGLLQLSDDDNKVLARTRWK